MKPLNVLFTLYSITAFVVIIERLLPQTRILLQPFNFIRLHEINQTVIFLSITVLLSFFMLRTISNNFHTLARAQSRVPSGTLQSILPLLMFIVGTYLYGAGEGWHEVASFTLNQYCNIHSLVGNLCHGLFINDFYAGNIIFFVGGVMMNVALLLVALRQPSKPFSPQDIAILVANSIVYAFTWFAYAAFDTVLVGLFFSLLLMVISDAFLLIVRNKFKEYPYIFYSAIAYTLATAATLIVRFH